MINVDAVVLLTPPRGSSLPFSIFYIHRVSVGVLDNCLFSGSIIIQVKQFLELQGIALVDGIRNLAFGARQAHRPQLRVIAPFLANNKEYKKN